MNKEQIIKVIRKHSFRDLENYRIIYAEDHHLKRIANEILALQGTCGACSLSCETNIIDTVRCIVQIQHTNKRKDDYCRLFEPRQ